MRPQYYVYIYPSVSSIFQSIPSCCVFLFIYTSVLQLNLSFVLYCLSICLPICIVCPSIYPSLSIRCEWIKLNFFDENNTVLEKSIPEKKLVQYIFSNWQLKAKICVTSFMDDPQLNLKRGKQTNYISLTHCDFLA